MRPGHGSALLLLAAAACGPAPESPPEEGLPASTDTIVAQWSEYPLGAPIGGNWVVVSADWDVAALANLGARSLTPLGQGARGGGRNQQAYLHPFQVFTFRDTIHLSDWGTRRTTVWTAAGQLVDSIPFPDRLRGTYLRGRDAAGQLYFQVDPQPRRDGSGNRDSSAIVRADRSLTRFDTVARLSPLELAEVTRENATRFEQRVFSGRDIWGVWPDGAVWVARRFQNRLETTDASGARVRGPSLPDPVYEVTPADRQLYLQGYPPDMRPAETDLVWAIIFPPFVAAFTAPDGSVWLEKTKQAADTTRRIHVLDRGGVLRRVFLLHGQGRLIAVGGEKVLIAERFSEGMRLREIRIPAALPPSSSPPP